MDKIFTIHSRKAERETFEILKKFSVKKAIFHWYTGPLKLISEILDSGYYFSVNIGMLKSANGQKILQKLPLNRIIIESDGPFTKYKSKVYTSKEIGKIYEEFENFYQVTDLKSIVYNNIKELLTE